MDGVLLEVRNRKERCHAWSLVATTSHVRTLSMLLFQDSMGTSITLVIPSSRYTTWLCLCVSKSQSDTLLASCYRQAIPLSHPFVPTTDYSSVSSSQFNGIIHRFSYSPSCRNLGM
jgi:hypothetical protein